MGIGYYVKECGITYRFDTRKEACRFIIPRLRHDYEHNTIYRDEDCKKVYATVQNMGHGVYNLYSGRKLKWIKETPKTVTYDGIIGKIRL